MLYVNNTPWRVGEQRPVMKEDIKTIQADGNELLYLRSRFTNLPFTSHRPVVIWRGEFARFIYDNL